MEDGYLGTAVIDGNKSLHIAELSRQSIIDSDAQHLGFDGYFLFQTEDGTPRTGIRVLARVASLDAAFAMLDLWSGQSA